jgi:hypothetical protein
MQQWILARLKEPSTWYGFGYIIAGAVAYLAPAQWHWIVAGATAAIGAGAVVVPEKK